MQSGRVLKVHSHDDGLNAWSMTRIAPPAGHGGALLGYCDYHERTGGFTTRRELPHAEGVLIFNLGEPIEITGGDGRTLRVQPGEAFVAGAHLRPAFSSSAGTQAGMHVFLPLLTLRRLTGLPMHRLIDTAAPLDALLGAGIRSLGAQLREAGDLAARVALLDTALAGLLAAAPLCPRQAHAMDLLRRRPDQDIAAIARDIGWSRKHLAGRVRDAAGVGPRSFRRLLRFQRLTGMMTTATQTDWAALAQDAGYCDQSHMIREFREFSGITPGMHHARALPDGGGLIEA